MNAHKHTVTVNPLGVPHIGTAVCSSATDSMRFHERRVVRFHEVEDRKWPGLYNTHVKSYDSCSACGRDAYYEYTATASNPGLPPSNYAPWVVLCGTCRKTERGETAIHATLCGCGVGFPERQARVRALAERLQAEQEARRETERREREEADERHLQRSVSADKLARDVPRYLTRTKSFHVGKWLLEQVPHSWRASMRDALPHFGEFPTDVSEIAGILERAVTRVLSRQLPLDFESRSVA